MQTQSDYQFVEQICVYLQAENQLHSHPRDIAKICKILILGTLGIHTQNDSINW